MKKSTLTIALAALLVFGVTACDKTVKTEATTEVTTERAGEPDSTIESTTVVEVPESSAPNATEQKEEVTSVKENADGSVTETTKKFEVSK